MIHKRESLSFTPETLTTLPTFRCIRYVTLGISVHR